MLSLHDLACGDTALLRSRSTLRGLERISMRKINPSLVGENEENSLSFFEVAPPHSLEQGDCRERGQRVETGDDNEHCRPTPGLLL
jgi:hypothetical protein